jgi:TonB-linked SusC/RagA family outer membrane protein
MKHITKVLYTLLLIVISITTMAVDASAQQNRTLSGVVSDENQEPVIGASVAIPGTSIGTATDINGKFQLSVPSNQLSIKVTYLGYQAQTVTLSANQSTVNIQLVPETQSLDELVVIGYGTVKRRDLTGSVSSVKSSDITMAPVTNVLEAIQGRVAGLDIAQTDGRVGSDVNIMLRGTRSLTTDSELKKLQTQPLYIIDGIQGSINDLNPNDIASIDVLKDASSTAIYGSAGANGIIIVTTKQAEKGKTQVDFNAYVGVNSNPRYPRALHGDAWIKYLQEGYRSTYPNAATPSNADLFTAYSYQPNLLQPYIDNGQWIDWVDEGLQTGVKQDYNISVRGSGEKMKGQFSLGYNDNQGVYLNDHQKRYTMRAGLDAKITKQISAGVQTGLIYADNDSRDSRINRAFSTLPLGDVYDANGEITQHPIAGMSNVNPIVDNVPGAYANNNKRISVTVNPYVEFKIMEGLSFKSILGTTLGASRRGVFNSDHTFMVLSGSQAAIRTATYSTTLNYNYNWENILNYNKVIAEDHSLGATLITSYAQRHSEKSSADNEGFLYDDYLYYNLGAGKNPRVSSNYVEYGMMSYAARLNYAYKGKYLLTASVRVDGASQLAKHWDTFPAAAVAWRVSDEGFMEGTQNWLSNLKLRVGYGVAGNSGIVAYSTKTELTSAPDPIDLGSGELQGTIPTQTVGNENLSWEKSYNLNVGLDFGLLNNRVEAAIEWCDTDTRGVLYARDLPYSGGGYTAKLPYKMTANLAKMHNRGIEISLTTHNIQTKDFKWTSTLTFAKNNEQFKDIDLGSGMKVEDLKTLGLFVNYPRNTVYGIKKLGIWQQDEAADAAVFGLLPGDVKVQSNLTKVSDGVWVDNTKDTPVEYTAANPYKVGNDDRVIYGQGDPKWTGGFQNSFYYKGFDLSLFVTARWGQTINSSLLGYFGREAMPETYDYWTPENPTNDFPRYYLQRTTQYTDPTQIASLSVVDGSYVKIKNITLGYELPRNLTQKAGISRVRFYGTLYNPIIFAKSHLLKDTDPESGAGDSFPLYRQMVFGVNVSF